MRFRSATALFFATAVFSRPASEDSVNIRTAHQSAWELATKEQLQHLLAAYNLEPWTFTHEVLIDEKAIPHSHPVLTLHTRHLHHDDELLSSYVHEQLHWFLSMHEADTSAAERNLEKMYPKVPTGYPEGAADTESTYLHLLVCRLEEKADEQLIGPARTSEVMRSFAQDHYTWIYRTVLSDGPRIDTVLQSHHLDHPEQ